MIDRRRFLTGASGALAGWALGGCTTTSHGVARHAVALPVQTLAGRVRLVTGAPGNVVVLAAGEGLTLVDAGSADLAPGIRAALGDARVRRVFNTHYHAEQTGGNVLFGSAGAILHAHEITREWLETDYYVPREDRWVKALPAAGWPKETFRRNGAITVGEEHVEFGYLLEAHTRGDIYVHFRDSNVLCVGDAASPQRDPAFDWYAGGWIGGRVDAMDLLLSRADEGTHIVPAYGPVMTRDQLQAERDLMKKLFDVTGNLLMEGNSAQDMLDKGVMNGIGRDFQDPYRFLYDVSKGLWAHYTNFGGRSV